MGLTNSTPKNTELHNKILFNPICDIDEFCSIMDTISGPVPEEIYAWKIACLYRFITQTDAHDIGLNTGNILNMYKQIVSSSITNLDDPNTNWQSQKNLYYMYLGSGNTDLLYSVDTIAVLQEIA